MRFFVEKINAYFLIFWSFHSIRMYCRNLNLTLSYISIVWTGKKVKQAIKMIARLSFLIWWMCDAGKSALQNSNEQIQIISTFCLGGNWKSDILCKFQRNNRMYTTIGNRDRKKAFLLSAHFHALNFSFIGFVVLVRVKCASALFGRIAIWIENGSIVSTVDIFLYYNTIFYVFQA